MPAWITQRRWRFVAVLGVLIGATVWSVVSFNGNVDASAAQGTVVTLVAPQRARTGERITVEVVAQQARDLAGFQASVRFDPATLRLVSAQLASDLKGSGRDLLPLGPVLREDAAVLGAATCPVAQCSAPQSQQARRIMQGVNGRVVLGSVDFYTETAGNYTLRLDGVQLVDPQGNLLGVTSVDTVLAVTAK